MGTLLISPTLLGGLKVAAVGRVGRGRGRGGLEGEQPSGGAAGKQSILFNGCAASEWSADSFGDYFAPSIKADE